MTAHSGRGIWMRVIALIAIAFGLLTIREGGAVLFFDGAARAAAGKNTLDADLTFWKSAAAAQLHLLQARGAGRPLRPVRVGSR